MNMSEEEFKKLYSHLAPETQDDLRKQLGIKEEPVQEKPVTEWWKKGYHPPEPKTPAAARPETKTQAPKPAEKPVKKPLEWWEVPPKPRTVPAVPIAPRLSRSQKKARRTKHIRIFLAIAYICLILSCVLPILLKIKP
jgi:hypothetical protein